MPGKIFPYENKFLAQTMKFGLKTAFKVIFYGMDFATIIFELTINLIGGIYGIKRKKIRVLWR